MDQNNSLALPGFYCKNKGHIPGYVPFTSVNDGICDYTQCCDGSEEWDGIVKCEDRCQKIGKDWRQAEEKRQKGLGNAEKRRKEMVLEAGKLRKQVEDRVQTLQTEIEAAEVKAKQVEAELVDIEKKEKGRVVRGSVSKKAGRLGVLVGLARQRTEELRTQLNQLREERDASRSRLQQVEGILTTFKEEYNPNFNDEGVKRAVRAWEDYAAQDKGPEYDAARERDLSAIAGSDADNGLDWAEYEGEDETSSDTDVLYDFELYLPPSLRTWIDGKLRDLRATLVANGVLAEPSTTSAAGDSKAVTDARSRVDSSKKDLENLRKDLTTHTEDLEKPFGPDDIFRALKGSCVSTDAGEYTYELCFLDKTTQKGKKGGGHTNMGNYVGLEKITVDDDLPADGKGLGSGERWAMKHENGQHCWNGPNRSTMVVLGCAEKEEVWRIVEEEKCVYRMEVGTPAVCESASAARKGRDEL